MGVYPADGDVPVLVCRRCRLPAEVDWCTVTMTGDPRAYVTPGRITCRTRGCVDGHGSTATTAPTTYEQDVERGISQLEDMLRDVSGGAA